MTDKERIKELLVGMANSDWCDNAAKRKIRNEILPLIDSLPEKPKLTEFERAIHRGFLCAGVKDVSITIIKETAKDALAQIQKPADKVEPKFKVGDWVVTDNSNVVCIKSIDNTNYVLRNTMRFTIDYVDKRWHLWTIQDAKAGDVLYLQKDGKEHIIIYKGVIKERFRTFVSAYCAYNGIVDAFCFADVSRYVDIAYGGIMPATKEQRDLLFQKMTEDGYEWDAEKKELKKIEQKSAWSEEDRQTLRLIIDDLSEELNDEPDEADKEILCRKISFLNSLKPHPIHKWNREDNRTRLEINNYLERQKREEPTRTDILNKWIAWIANLDPQWKQNPTWSEEDKRKISRIYSILREASDEHAFFTTNRILGDKECVELQDWLKSLRPQNKWKPSEEQLKALKKAHLRSPSLDESLILGELIEQLKKLR